MVLTRKTNCSTSSPKKQPNSAKKRQFEVEIHQPLNSGTDIKDVEADETPLQSLSTPTVSLEDINARKRTPKLTPNIQQVGAT